MKVKIFKTDTGFVLIDREVKDVFELLCILTKYETDFLINRKYYQIEIQNKKNISKT